MFKNLSNNEVCYFLPEDGNIAKQDLLKQFDLPNLKEIYIKAYAFNWDDLLTKVKEVDQKGIQVHILADYVQSRGPSAWDKLVDLHKTLKNGELILTTAGANSPSTSQIWHSKAITFLQSNNEEPTNWEGSVNFSGSGWEQGNTASIFSSQIWSDNFISHFKIHKQWAIDNAAHKQIDFLLNNPVQAADLEITEETADLIFELNTLKKSNQQFKSFTYLAFFIIILQWFVFWTPVCK